MEQRPERANRIFGHLASIDNWAVVCACARVHQFVAPLTTALPAARILGRKRSILTMALSGP